MTTSDLLTSRLHLRLLCPDDAALYTSLFTNDEVMQWVSPTFSPDDALRAFASTCKHNVAHHPGHRFWKITYRESGAEVGIASMRRSGTLAEIGAMLAPAWWNRGITREAFVAIVQSAFNDMGITSIEVRRPADAQAVVVGRMLAAVGFPAATAMDDGSLLWRLRSGDRGAT